MMTLKRNVTAGLLSVMCVVPATGVAQAREADLAETPARAPEPSTGSSGVDHPVTQPAPARAAATAPRSVGTGSVYQPVAAPRPVAAPLSSASQAVADHYRAVADGGVSNSLGRVSVDLADTTAVTTDTATTPVHAMSRADWTSISRSDQRAATNHAELGIVSAREERKREASAATRDRVLYAPLERAESAFFSLPLAVRQTIAPTYSQPVLRQIVNGSEAGYAFLRDALRLNQLDDGLALAQVNPRNPLAYTQMVTGAAGTVGVTQAFEDAERIKVNPGDLAAWGGLAFNAAAWAPLGKGLKYVGQAAVRSVWGQVLIGGLERAGSTTFRGVGELTRGAGEVLASGARGLRPAEIEPGMLGGVFNVAGRRVEVAVPRTADGISLRLVGAEGSAAIHFGATSTEAQQLAARLSQVRDGLSHYVQRSRPAQLVPVMSAGGGRVGSPTRGLHQVKFAADDAVTGAGEGALAKGVDDVARGAGEGSSADAVVSSRRVVQPCQSADVEALCMRVDAASRVIGRAPAEQRTALILSVADELEANADAILAANRIDVERSRGKITEALLSRLTLDRKGLSLIAGGIREVAAFEDPIGQVVSETFTKNGVRRVTTREALGVVATAFESRPNVGVETFAIQARAGNASILRGSSAASHTNAEMANAIAVALERNGLPIDAAGWIVGGDHAEITILKNLDQYVDLLIPRGGKALKEAVKGGTVKTLGAGPGKNTALVMPSAKLTESCAVIINAKVQKPGVCNALETLLVHRDVAREFLPQVFTQLDEAGVRLHVTDEVRALIRSELPELEPRLVDLVPDDWDTEWLTLDLTVGLVDDLDQGIVNIAQHGTGHSELILTESAEEAQRFFDEVDAAAVYWNASTRHTDGSVFGLGAEVAISTEKFHARGPMGIRAMTTTKDRLYGDYNVRP